MTQREKSPGTASAEEVLSAFLAEAADIEPTRLSSPAQLLWRAEVLARLEAEERRAQGALLPVLVGIVVAVAVGAAGLSFAFAGIESPAGVSAWLGSSPLRLLGFGITTLVTVLVFFTRTVRPVTSSSAAGSKPQNYG